MADGTGLPITLILITTGGILVYSAVTDVTLVDLFSGAAAGVKRYTNPGGTGAGPESTVGPPPKGADNPALGGVRFKGPYAAQLEALAQKAVREYDLGISQICRPQDAGYGAPNSLHKQCRAFDAVGSVTNRVAFARDVKANDPWIDEVFCDQAGMVAPGYDHSDHVHVGA